MSKLVKVFLAVAGAAGLAACTVNTPAPAPATPAVVVAPPAPVATPGSTVVIPR